MGYRRRRYEHWGKVGKSPTLLPRQHGTGCRKRSHVETEQNRVVVASDATLDSPSYKQFSRSIQPPVGLIASGYMQYIKLSRSR
jgi:hypothetical protein